MARSTYGTGSMTETSPGSGVWRYRWRADGKQHRATYHGTRKQAEQQARRATGQQTADDKASDDLEALLQSSRPKPKRTFGLVLDEWVAEGRTGRGKPWAGKTASEIRSEIERHIRPALGHIALASLSVADLQRTYSEWTANGLSDGYVHKLAAHVKTALGFAWRLGYVPENVALKSRPPAQPKSRGKSMPTAAEVTSMRQAAIGDELKVLLLAVLIGAREGELAALRWADVDLSKGTIQVNRSASYFDGRTIIKETKTDANYVAKLANGNLTALVAALGEPGKPNVYVIGGKPEPMAPYALGDLFQNARRRAGVRPGVTLHGCRHFWSSSMLTAGLSPHDVSEGRWASPRMVLDVYAHASETASDRRAAVELL